MQLRQQQRQLQNNYADNNRNTYCIHFSSETPPFFLFIPLVSLLPYVSENNNIF